jgi:hypothetical protein
MPRAERLLKLAELLRGRDTTAVSANQRKEITMSPLPFLIRKYLTGLVVFPLLLVTVAHAAPSGGPYGPIAQSYPIPKAGHVYYVAPDGSASAAGTTPKVPTTLESAIARVVTGDTIVLRGGIYRTGNLVLNQGIVLQPYADEKPVLKGTEVATKWEAVGAHVWRTSWSKLFPSKPMHWWQREREEARTPMHRFNNDMVFVDGQFLQSAGSVAELSEHTHFIDYERQAVYIGVDPAAHTIEITAHDIGLLRATGEVHGKVTDKKGPVIVGLTFTQYAWAPIAVDGKRHFTHLDEPVDEPVGPADPSTYGKEVVGTVLQNVTLSYSSRVAGYFRGDGLVIRNSLISDTGTEGLYVIGSSDVLLERNIVRRNNIERVTGYFASAVKVINQTHNVVMRDNLVIDHPNSNGVWYDVGNRNGAFVNNYVEGANVGFFFEISRGVTVAGNVFANNGLGSWILNSADAQVYNNTYVDSPARFARNERSAQGDHFAWHPATGPGVDEREGHVFVNNLLVASAPGVGPLLRVDQAPALCERLTRPALRTMDGNVYLRPGTQYSALATALITWVDKGSPSCAADFASLEVFRAQAPGFEAHGRQLEGDARSVFTAPDLRRYQLLRPLRTTGEVTMPAAARKLLGWSKTQAALTVGAYTAE